MFHFLSDFIITEDISEVSLLFLLVTWYTPHPLTHFPALEC